MQESRISTAARVVNAAFSALAPMLVLIIVCAVAGVFPFGEKLLLCGQNSGWFGQLAHYHAALTGDESVFYSLSTGLGGDFYSAFSEGFGNPFWLLTAFYTADALHGSISVIMMIQSAAAGLFAYFMFSRLCREQNLAAVVFAAAYAGGSLLVLGFLAPQYAGAAVFLPLVGTGVLLLCEKGSLITLFLSMLLFLVSAANLWSCLLIFCAVFFAWGMLVLGDRSQMGIRTALLIVSAGLAFGSAMLMLLPPLITETELAAALPAVSEIDSASLPAIINALFPGGFSGEEAAPIIFCSSVVLILLPGYFFNPKLGLGERQVSGGMLLLLLICMAVPSMGWVWLCGTETTGVVVGFSFVFCLLACACAIRSLSESTKGSVRMMVLSWFAVMMLFFVSVALRWGKAPVELLIFSAAALTFFAAITLVVLSNRRISVAFCVILLFCVCCECVLGGVYSVNNADDALSLMTLTDYSAKQEKELWIDSTIASSEEGAASPFFRIRGAQSAKNYSIGGNETATPRAAALLDAMGIRGSEGYTPFTDALFGVRYIVGDGSRAESRYPLVGADEAGEIYKNDAAISLGLSAPAGIAGLSSFSANPFAAQNELASVLAGAPRNLFNLAEITGWTGIGATVSETLTNMEMIRHEAAGYVRFSVLSPADGLLYMYIDSESPAAEYVQMGQNVVPLMPGAIGQVGYVTRGQSVEVTMTVSPERLSVEGIYFAVLDSALCTAALEQFSASQAEGLGVVGSHIYARVNMPEGHIFVTSIPYMAGWRVSIDGSPADSCIAAGALLAIEVPPGEHSLELWYEPVYFTASLVISLMALAVGMIYCCAAEALRRRRQAEEEMRQLLSEEEAALAEEIYESGGYIEEMTMEELLSQGQSAPEYIDYSAPVFAPNSYAQGASYQPPAPDFGDYSTPGYMPHQPTSPVYPQEQFQYYPKTLGEDYTGEYYDQYTGVVEFQSVETLELEEEE